MADSRSPGSFWAVRPKWPYFLLIAICVALDLWTKETIFERIGPHGRETVIAKFLWFVHVENPGAIGGLGGGHPEWLVGARLLACAVLGILILRTPARRWFLCLSFSLVIAGALGNLYDNLLNPAHAGIGPVRDFIEMRLFLPFDIPGLIRDQRPNAFNVADACIVSGAVLLLISSFFGATPEKRAKA